jgi:hypothetical protein
LNRDNQIDVLTSRAMLNCSVTVSGGAGADVLEEDNEAAILDRQAAAQMARGELANAELLYHLALQERKLSSPGKQTPRLAANLGRLAETPFSVR